MNSCTTFIRMIKVLNCAHPQLLTDIEARYDASALNCWIAALIYLGTLAVSTAAFYANSRAGEVPKEPLENFASING